MFSTTYTMFHTFLAALGATMIFAVAAPAYAAPSDTFDRIERQVGLIGQVVALMGYAQDAFGLAQAPTAELTGASAPSLESILKERGDAYAVVVAEHAAAASEINAMRAQIAALKAQLSASSTEGIEVTSVRAQVAEINTSLKEKLATHKVRAEQIRTLRTEIAALKIKLREASAEATSSSTGSTSSTGTYIGYMDGAKFIETKNITREDALENCKINATANPATSIKCQWNGKVIYAPESTSSSSSKGIYSLSADDKTIIDRAGVTKASALAKCKAYIKKHPEPQVTCAWEGTVIHKVPGTDPRKDEVIFKTSDEDPDATTIVVDTEERSDWMTVFAFEIDTDDSFNDIVAESIVIKVESPSGESIKDMLYDAKLLIGGEEFDDFEEINKTAASMSLEFDMDGDIEFSPGKIVTAELQISFRAQGGQYDNGATIRASALGAESKFESDDDFIGSGSVTGETHTLRSEGLDIIIVDTSERLLSNSDMTTKDDQGVFTIEFDVTAFDMDAYINKSALRSSSALVSSSGVHYVITNGSGSVINTVGMSSATLSSTADTSNGRYVIEEGETETFTLTVIYDPSSSGFYGVQLIGLGINEISANADSFMKVTPAADFETNPLSVRN